MIGALSDVGLSSAARRFIPEYTELKAFDRLRGFLAGSRWLAFAIATAIGAVGALGVTLLRPTSITSPSFRFISPASPFRSTAWCRCRPASRSPTTGPIWRCMPFYICRQLAITAADGRGLGARRADRRGDRHDHRGRHHLGGDHRPAFHARPPAQAQSAGRAEALRGENLVCHLAADLRGGRLLSAAHLRRHSGARAAALAATRWRSITPPRACWRWSPSSISPSPAPPRTSSRNTTWTATRSGWPSSSPRPSAGPSGRRLPPAPLILALGRPLLSLFGAGLHRRLCRDVHPRRRHAVARRRRAGRAAAQHAGRAQAMRRHLCPGLCDQS